MPKNTQMHMQWITVNGQSVPLVLPQYWDGEKWVISSEQNPLPVKAQLTGSNAEDTITYQRFGELPGGGFAEILVDIKDKECELLSFSMGTDYPHTQVRIHFYDKDGNIDGSLRIANQNGTSLMHPTPSSLQENSEGENDFWSVAKYDDANNAYVLTMKRPLKCLNGLRIEIRNFDTQAHNVAINTAIASWSKE